MLLRRRTDPRSGGSGPSVQQLGQTIAAAVDRLDRADRVDLSADRDLKRVLADIDRADGALHLRGNGDRLAVGPDRIDRQSVVAIRPGDAVIALAVPRIGLAAGGERRGPGVGDLFGRAG